mgnify:CR=1 FL=1
MIGDNEANDCPVCLAPLSDPATTMQMPICGHCIHTTCALSAAQYDVRCPVCRTKDPSIESRLERETRIFAQLEEYAARQARLVRSYKRRRAALTRRHASLKKMRNQVREEKKKFSELNTELDRTWIRVQRDRWRNDATIEDIKLRRRRQQRRVHAVSRRLKGRLYSVLGTPPESMELEGAS